MICKPGTLLLVLLAMGLTGCIARPSSSSHCPIPERAGASVVITDRALWTVPPAKPPGLADDDSATTSAP